MSNPAIDIREFPGETTEEFRLEKMIILLSFDGNQRVTRNE